MARTPDVDQFLNNLPEDGTSIGNISLIEKLGWSSKTDRYWEVQRELYNQNIIGLGKGKGGSVYRILSREEIEEIEKTDPPQPTGVYPDENSLYIPFLDTIKSSMFVDPNITDSIFEVTANLGSRKTGGGWTRPDIVALTIHEFQYIPGKVFNITTFELKHSDYFNIYGVFETAAHTKFANKAYYVGYLPNGWNDEDESMVRISRECERFGLGLIIFKDPKDFNSYEFKIEPERKIPDPADQDEFIRNQIREDTNLRKLGKWVR